MKQIKLLLFGIMILLSLNFVSAWSNNNFTNNLTIGNLTFTYNENITRYLTIPSNTILTNGFLNLSGYNYTTYGRNLQISYVGSCSDQGNQTDRNLSTGVWTPDTAPGCNIYENWTKSPDLINPYLYARIDMGSSSFTYCWNYNTSQWDEIGFRSGGSLKFNCTTGNIIQTKIILPGNSCSGSSVYDLCPRYIEGYMEWQGEGSGANYFNTSGVYPNNVSLSINSQVWNYSGQFNQLNNKTNNLANYINSYLSSCSYIAGFCYVPFTFHSDTAGILSYSDLIFNNYGLIENSQKFNSPVTSQSSQNFKINITYDPNYYTTSTATLNYNGTIYSSSVTTSNGNTIFSSTFNVPQVNNLTNYTFFWNISLTNSSGVNYFTSNSNNQSVSNINFGICTSTLNVSYINFTIRDFTTKGIINATFKSTWYIGNSSYQNYSYQDLTEANNSFAFCFSPSNANYQVTAIIEYDNSIRAKNYYYITNSILTNVTNNITLYLLNDSLTTLTQFLVEDRTRKPISDVYITIQSYDVGTDTFYTTAMLKTGYDGTDLAYLNWYDTLYRYTLVKDGRVIQSTNSSKISESPKSFLVLDTETFLYDKFSSMVYSLTFNNATNNFILTFTDPTGLVTAGCLKVIKQGSINQTIICDTCEYTSSATLYCNIASYGNGTYIGSFYALGSYDTIYSIITSIGSSFQNNIYNLLGNVDASFYAFLFAGIVMVFFMVSPVMGVFGAMLGVFGAIMLGFQNVDIGIFIGVIIIGAVVIWILKR